MSRFLGKGNVAFRAALEAGLDEKTARATLEEVGRLRERARRYGVSPLFLRRLLKAQGWKCAVCRRPFEGDFAVDHDHRTGRIRGLLCRRGCNANVVLGLVQDDPALLEAMADYLRKQS